MCCSIDVNLYAKLTPYGEAFLNQDTVNQWLEMIILC
jgi:hypothetical protein